MSPLEFMQRLAALVPRPRLKLIRFHGALAPNAKLRSEIILGSRKNKSNPPAGIMLCHLPRFLCVSVGYVCSSGCSILTLSIVRIIGEPWKLSPPSWNLTQSLKFMTILACPPERRLEHLRKSLIRPSQPDPVLVPISSLHHWADLYPRVTFTKIAKKSLKPTLFAVGQKQI